MAFTQIAGIAPNYRDYKNWWLKAYDPGTTTPKLMSDNDTGSPTSAKYELNKDGFIISSGGTLIIPHVDGDYDLWLFPTEAEADANNTTNAIRVADDIENLITAGTIAESIGGVSPLVFSTLVDAQGDGFGFSTTTGGQKLKLKAGDVARIEDLGNSYFNLISGTGTVNGYNILGHATLDLSFVLITDGVNVSAKSLGAVADGTDQSPLFNHFMTQMSENYIHLENLGSGSRYRCFSTIWFRENKGIIGAGRDLCGFSFDASALPSIGSGSTALPNFDNRLQCKNIRLEDFSISHDSGPIASGEGVVRISWTNNVVIQRLNIEGGGDSCIRVDGYGSTFKDSAWDRADPDHNTLWGQSKDILIQDIECGGAYLGIELEGGAKDVTIKRTEVTSAQLHAYRFPSAENVELYNPIGSSAQQGLYLDRCWDIFVTNPRFNVSNNGIVLGYVAGGYIKGGEITAGSGKSFNDSFFTGSDTENGTLRDFVIEGVKSDGVIDLRNLGNNVTIRNNDAPVDAMRPHASNGISLGGVKIMGNRFLSQGASFDQYSMYLNGDPYTGNVFVGLQNDSTTTTLSIYSNLVVPMLNLSDAQFNDINNDINQINKFSGKMAYNFSIDKPVWADSNTPGAVWRDAQGIVTNTPV